jgi:hypothetical protein
MRGWERISCRSMRVEILWQGGMRGGEWEGEEETGWVGGTSWLRG